MSTVPRKAKPYDIRWPLTPKLLEDINANFDDLYKLQQTAAGETNLKADAGLIPNVWPEHRGGTGENTYAKGTILAGDSALGLSLLLLGTDGFVLQALASEATGLKWTSPDHALLSARHSDVTAAGVVRGDVIVGSGATPLWTRLPKGTSGFVFTMGADEPAWSAPGPASDGLTSASGTAPLTLTLAAKALTGSIAITPTNSGGAVALQTATPGTAQTGHANISGTIIAGGFSGPITGNVTGNVSGSSGSCTGNAATATKLATARAINGVDFDGTGPITIAAAAGTLTGTALPGTVVTSSLTAVGTIMTGVWNAGSVTSSSSVSDSVGSMATIRAAAGIWTRAGTVLSPTTAGDTLDLGTGVSIKTPAESWIGPSNVTGIYFKDGNVGIGTTNPTIGALQITGGSSFTNIPANTSAVGNINSTTGWSGQGFLFGGTGANDAFGLVYPGGGIAYFGGVTNTTQSPWVTMSSAGINVKTLTSTGSGNSSFNGNVGIGTTNPGAKLAITDTISSGVKVLEDIYTPSYIEGDDWTMGSAIRIGYSAGSGNDNHSSRIVSYGNPATNYGSRLQLQTHNTSSGSWNTGLLIDSTGNVGIGTTSPTSLFQVNGLINMKNYIVSTLPAGVRGDIAYVTDALLPTFLAIIAGGGAVVTPVFFNGTNWIGF